MPEITEVTGRSMDATLPNNPATISTTLPIICQIDSSN
jgi:hypothetical protein